MPAAVQLAGVSAHDITIKEIHQHIGADYNIPPATPAFSYRSIAGVPPQTEQSAIQHRTWLVEAIYMKLTQPGINALALTGIGGVGKSTLAALLYRYTEAQSSIGKGFFQAPPLWLSIDQAATFADVIGTIFQQLYKPLSNLDNLSPAGQVEALFTLFDKLELPRLIVLDQFDKLLDWTTGKALSTQPGVGEWIDALNSRPWKTNSRLLLTSRSFPQGTLVAMPLCFKEYTVGGLMMQESLALLRSRGIQASEADMQTAVSFCDGHPLSLVLLVALIQLYHIPLADLLAKPTLWIGDIAVNLLDAVVHRLTEQQRAILRALSVYRTAVPITALAAFLAGASSQQILLSLKPLLVQQVIQPAENGCYQLHVVVSRYVQTHFVKGDEQANQEALKAAHARAAQFYQQRALTSCPPRESRRHVSDVHDLIEAIWHYCKAEQQLKAYYLMVQENITANLNLWGGNAILLDLYQLLLTGKWHPKGKQAATLYNNLGRICDELGKKEEALTYYEQALTIRRKIKDRIGEGVTLNNLGILFFELGKQEKAVKYYEQALTIRREVQDLRGEGTTLNNLGSINAELGKTEEALQYYEQALNIHRAVDNRPMEGKTLNYMGAVYNDLSMKEKALQCYKQALSIQREIGNSDGEGETMHNLGAFYFEHGRYDVALAYLLLARKIFEEIHSPNRNNAQQWINALREKVGEGQFTALLAQVEPQAHEIVEQSLRERT